MPTVSLRRTPHRDHLVVCGDDALAARTVEELTTRYGEYVTVILPSRQRNYRPWIAGLPGVRVIERDQLSSDAFRDAHVQSARGLGLLKGDDLGNFHGPPGCRATGVPGSWATRHRACGQPRCGLGLATDPLSEQGDPSGSSGTCPNLR